MKKILLSVLSVGVVGAVAFGATQAFFSDTETSTGNTFTAGEIDLTVDSTAHYAGMICNTDHVWQDEENNSVTQNDTSGISTRPELLGQACLGSWTATNLDTHSFFNYSDVKPGDEGENTLSLHVTSNESWACAQIGNIVDAENTLTEPELDLNDTNATGELSENLYFTAWLDQGTTPGFGDNESGEGDNVWQQGEPFLFSNGAGPASDVINGVTYPLFDSTTAGLTGTMQPGTTYYLGLQWCAGTMTADVTNGISCDGATMGNDTQTDSMTADISFYVEQVRNNPNFECSSLSALPVQPN